MMLLHLYLGMSFGLLTLMTTPSLEALRQTIAFWFVQIFPYKTKEDVMAGIEGV